jgi:hypothetical protein
MTARQGGSRHLPLTLELGDGGVQSSCGSDSPQSPYAFGNDRFSSTKTSNIVISDDRLSCILVAQPPATNGRPGSKPVESIGF